MPVDRFRKFGAACRRLSRLGAARRARARLYDMSVGGQKIGDQSGSRRRRLDEPLSGDPGSGDDALSGSELIRLAYILRSRCPTYRALGISCVQTEKAHSTGKCIVNRLRRLASNEGRERTGSDC